MDRGETCHFLRFLLPALVVGLLVGDVMARDHSRNVPPQDRADAVSRLSGLVKSGEPGFAVLVREGGKTLVQQGFGVRDLRSKQAIDANTNFRLASCAKQFTAIAVMLLVKDGKLGYDETLGAIWPDFPDYGKAITIRQMLHHTSGLPDYEDGVDALLQGKQADSRAARPDMLLDDGLAQITDQGVYTILKQTSAARFAPGSRWSYSNSGYVMLGLLVAKVSGQPFPQFLHDRIFAPLHMGSTLAHVHGHDTIRNRAYGHTREGDAFRETDQSPTSATLGDGGIYSNLADLAKWDDALRRHTLLSAAEMQPALSPALLADGSQPHWPADPDDNENLHPGQPVFYGFGWFLDPHRPGAREDAAVHPRMWHYGSTMGFRSIIERYTGEALTVMVLANRTDLDPGVIAEQIAASYLDGSRAAK
jgi:CubicO group peptidase (beta-lactamase class C family)